MRISQKDVNQIRTTAKSIFGDQSEVYLFGSRVIEDAKGGDIDLLIKTPDLINLLDKKLDFLVKIKKLIGDQKIDLIIRSKSAESFPEDIIYRRALKGVKL